MSTKIEWTDESWNPIRARLRADPARVGWHCEHKSPGCEHCYAETLNRDRFGTGLPYKPGHRKDVETFLDEKALLKPLHWRRPRKVFVCSMTDLFADFVTDEMIDRVFAVMALCPQHVFQVLTKRADRMRAYFETPVLIDGDGINRGREVDISGALKSVASAIGLGELDAFDRNPFGGCRPGLPLPNVWLGVSVEDQARADERIPDLLATPAAVRFLSCEPLLGPVDLTRVRRFGPTSREYINATGARMWTDQSGLPNPDPAWAYPGMPFSEGSRGLNWVICGGESGPGARPMHPDWARALRDQCAGAGVPFFFKQWGEFAPGEIAGDYLDPDRVARGLSLFDGSWDEVWSYPDGHCDDEPDVYRVGKRRAGRLLDGELHDGMPS